jgi:hypothetical protein
MLVYIDDFITYAKLITADKRVHELLDSVRRTYPVALPPERNPNKLLEDALQYDSTGMIWEIMMMR